jgi:monofunctional biosynthetic peptidoglycan transglycosylase
VIVFALVAWYFVIPYPWTLRDSDPERTALMEQRISEARDEGVQLDIRQEWVPLDEMSRELVRAVLVAEDYRFRLHAGVDWVSLAEEVQWTGDEEFSWLSVADLRSLASALSYAWDQKDELRGRSTITQQLAKNLYFGTERSFMRKGLELVVAGRLERRLGKDRILELYLNTAEWGPGIFGAEAAARSYFDRSSSSLTLEQAATLAATLPQPLTSNAKLRPSRMLWRRDLILTRLDPDRGVDPEPLPDRDPDFAVPRDPVDVRIDDLRELEPLVGPVPENDPRIPSLDPEPRSC